MQIDCIITTLLCTHKLTINCKTYGILDFLFASAVINSVKKQGIIIVSKHCMDVFLITIMGMRMVMMIAVMTMGITIIMTVMTHTIVAVTTMIVVTQSVLSLSNGYIHGHLYLG